MSTPAGGGERDAKDVDLPRVGVYTDYAYSRAGGTISAQLSFALFLRRVSAELGGMTLLGRVEPGGSALQYPVGDADSLRELPYYARLSRPGEALRAMAGSLRVFWKALDELDLVWLFGPHPMALAFAVIAAARGRRVVIGVRQDFPAYTRSRHPDRTILVITAVLLEGAFRVLGRFCGAVVVGPDLAKNFRHARSLLDISVSLVQRTDVVDPSSAIRDYSGEVTVLSVGRLDSEKNPLLLAETLRVLEQREPGRFRMVICGDGPERPALAERLAALGVTNRAELLGYVPVNDGLMARYRSSHVLLHVSWTEGLPQVLLEAFSAATPVVATDVGGVREAVEGAALLILPGDAEAAAGAVQAVCSDDPLRERLRESAHTYVCSRTVDVEAARVVSFLRGGDPG